MNSKGIGRRLALTLYFWFAVATTLSASEIPTYLPTWSIGPIIFFLLAVLLIGSFATESSRAFVKNLNMRWITMFHVWRFVPGVAFLVLYAVDLLPARFALTLGVGDVLVAITAPLVANRFELSQKRVLLFWHCLGIFDLLQGIVGGLALVLAGNTQMSLMTHFPLSMLPLFFVPLTLAMHVFALYIFWSRR